MSTPHLPLFKPSSAILNQPPPGPADGFWVASDTFFIQTLTGPCISCQPRSLGCIGIATAAHLVAGVNDFVVGGRVRAGA